MSIFCNCIKMFRRGIGDMKEFQFLILILMIVVTSANDTGSRIKRNILFIPGAGMGIYLAIAFPVDLPNYDLSISFNFEANYLLPTNASELAYGPQLTEVRKARDLTRGRIYSLLEDRFEKEGFLSKTCLLRTICETSASTILGHNGLLGEILHIIFTPSSTVEENLSPAYSEAEKAGLDGRENCIRSYPDCPIDLYEFISQWSG